MTHARQRGDQFGHGGCNAQRDHANQRTADPRFHHHQFGDAQHIGCRDDGYAQCQQCHAGIDKNFLEVFRDIFRDLLIFDQVIFFFVMFAFINIKVVSVGNESAKQNRPSNRE